MGACCDGKKGLRNWRSVLCLPAHLFPTTNRQGYCNGAAAEGAGEELVQNPIEQLSGYQDPTTKANILDTLHGSAMGAIGGVVSWCGMARYCAEQFLVQFQKQRKPLTASGATFKAEFDRVNDAGRTGACRRTSQTGPKNEQSQENTQGTAEVPQGRLVLKKAAAALEQHLWIVWTTCYTIGRFQARIRAFGGQPAGVRLSQSQIVQPGAATPAVGAYHATNQGHSNQMPIKKPSRQQRDNRQPLPQQT